MKPNQMTKYLTISVMGETCMAYSEGCAVARNGNSRVVFCRGGKWPLVIRH